MLTNSKAKSPKVINMRDLGTMSSLLKDAVLEAVTCPKCSNNGVMKITFSITNTIRICTGCNHVIGD